MEYNLTVIDNIYTFVNEEQSTINLKIEYKANCSDELIIYKDTTPVNTTTTFDLSKKDGIYVITLIHLEEEVILTIESYYNFFLSMINDIHYILCGCNSCNDCEDCGKEEKDYLSAILKILAYDILKDGIYTRLVTNSDLCIRCNIIDINQCILLNQTVLGEADNTNLMKQIIAYYYLLIFNNDVEISRNIIFPLKDYKYSEIIKCIKKLGIDFNCIKDSLIPKI